MRKVLTVLTIAAVAGGLFSLEARPVLAQKQYMDAMIAKYEPASKLIMEQKCVVCHGKQKTQRSEYAKAIEKALEYNRHSRRTRGASTLTQQVAKNLFLWPGRSWFRKGLEVGYTLLIETLWSKRRVLEVYLNVAEFGRGVYGVEAAAQKYFRKPAAQLSAQEAALLAAVLPSPARLRVDAPSAYVQNRAAWIRGQMNGLGYETLDSL